MPWSRLRTNRPGDTRSLRRHSTIDPAMSGQKSEQLNPDDSNHLSPDNHEAVKSPSPLRKSFEPHADEHAAHSKDRPETPNAQEPPNRQRFSMLRFRHASDPQISKTARDQSLGTIPPMPAGESSSGYCTIR